MATNALPHESKPFETDIPKMLDLGTAIKLAVAPLASLKLTVTFLTLGVILVLIGTLAQDKQGMWEVIDNFFRLKPVPPHFGFVWVDAEIMFPLSWFPEMTSARAAQYCGLGIGLIGFVAAGICALTMSDTQARTLVPVAIIAVGFVAALLTVWQRGFIFPGGILIGGVLFANLVAAHAVRFTVQTKGSRLTIGLLIIALGVLTAVVVIINGHNSNGLQGEPPFSWVGLWSAIKLSLIPAFGASLFASIYYGYRCAVVDTTDRKALPMSILAGSLAIPLGVVVVLLWMLYPSWQMSDSALRIVWQLFQGSIAAIVLLVGCLVAFKKRAGIVLLHAGVGLMMFNELFVGYHAEEQNMLVVEGKTENFTTSDQVVEIAVIDPSSSENNVVAIPLIRNGIQTDHTDNLITHESLPFNLEVDKFHRNSSLVQITKEDEKKRTTSGIGRVYYSKRKRPYSAAESQTNLASAYVTVTDKQSGKELGTYLLSQLRSDMQRLMVSPEVPERVASKGKTYELYLRFQRIYKDYSIRLIDVKRDVYVGTETPSNFSSDIEFIDNARDTTLEHHISMNNPMRYAGWTFYQSGYNNLRPGLETTTLQVVKNRGWMIPYVGCMFVVFGMGAHFLIALTRFINRLVNAGQQDALSRLFAEGGALAVVLSAFASRDRQNPATFDDHEEPQATTRVSHKESGVAELDIAGSGLLMRGWIVPLAILALCAVYLVGRARPPRAKPDAMQIHEFGTLPVVWNGREKPMDSLARDSLRVLSKYETLKDEEGERHKAIVWLLDVISGSEKANKHAVFKITNLELLGSLGLERRKGFLYTYEEINKARPKFEPQLVEAGRVAEEDPRMLTNYQRKLRDLNSKIRLYDAVRLAFSHPSVIDDEEIRKEVENDAYQYGKFVRAAIMRADRFSEEQLPYAIPMKSESGKWMPLHSAYVPVWLHKLAKERDVETPRELAKSIVDDARRDREQLVQEHLADLMLEQTMEIVAQGRPELDPDQVESFALNMLHKAKNEQPGLIAELSRSVREEYFDRRLDEIERQIAFSITSNGYGKAIAGEVDPVARTLGDVLVAYREGDVDDFNDSLSEYEELLADHSGDYELDRATVNREAYFNFFEPLFKSYLLYLFAFVLVGLSWFTAVFGGFRMFSRAAMLVILLASSVHTWSLVERYMISGRPPVTNLYSSAVFIGWAVVIFGLAFECIFRVGIGNVIASVGGFLTLAIAMFGLAADNNGDTMGVMQAVLDTQFWLATHVVCITLGYATTFVAGAVGTIYVLLGVFTPLLPKKIRDDWTLDRALSALTYGIICFAIFFSFFGTVLGGLWADDSWGRFWGWDPKENGALIIVLWNAVILHARWGGMVKSRGLAVLSIVGNIVTAWSWFGVNQLGIGLHSYGFTEGVLRVLSIYVLTQLALVALGLLPKDLWASHGGDGPTSTPKLGKQGT